MRYFVLSFLFCVLLCACKKPKTTLIFTDSVFTEGIEGPAVAPNGDLYLVNFEKNGTIAKVLLGTDVPTLFSELPNGSIGNGIRFLNDSIFFIADYVNHQIFKANTKTVEITVFVTDSNMNQPNDLAIMKNGTLFASDPNWKNNSGQLWRITKDGKTTLLEKNMGTTNGIEVSPNDEFLYVNESVQRKIWKYNLDEHGNISNKQLFYEFDDFGLDGMRCDTAGNLYLARHGKGTVAILSPQGELLEEIDLIGKNPSNVAFGASDWRTVYVTIQDKKWIEIFHANVKGREPFNK